MKILIDAAFGKEQLAGLELWGVEFVRHLARFDKVNSYIIYGYFWKNFRQRKEMVYVPAQQNFSLYINRIPKHCVHFLESHNVGIVEKLINKQKIDIFHGIGFFLPKLKKAKGIISVHGLDFMELNVTWYRDKWYKHFSTYLKRADKIIAVSEYVKKIIMDLYNLPEGKITVIYPGIRDNFVFYGTDREKVVSPDKKSYIVCVVTSVERKNLKRILTAFSTIKDKHRDINLMIVGDKKMLLDTLRECIEKLSLSDRIHLPGYLGDDQLPFVYNNAKCLVFPSLYEGFGLPIIEAMACGCPVITSNISAMPEVVDDAGILVDPYKEEEIGEAMHTVLSNQELRENMRVKGLKRSRFFSWEKTAREILRVYEDVTAGRGGS